MEETRHLGFDYSPRTVKFVVVIAFVVMIAVAGGLFLYNRVLSPAADAAAEVARTGSQAVSELPQAMREASARKALEAKWVELWGEPSPYETRVVDRTVARDTAIELFGDADGATGEFGVALESEDAIFFAEYRDGKPDRAWGLVPTPTGWEVYF
ncbi:MAG: hypothetical protein PHW75_01700 [Patescibacteria group bacterium]|nr:hypothetical protein [Patescibacteria group bacterium]